MPKKENTPEVPENSDAKEIQKWSVWTQGPKDAKETKRKFKQITPGQSRDYKYLVKNRKMQRYEEVILTAEDAPTMSAGTGGFSSNPEKSGVDGYDPILGGKTTKVYRRKPRLPVDGRTKGYREAVKRILDRNHKRQQQEIAQRLSQFGVSSNPFQREETNMSKKYLKTKEGSIEAAVLTSIATEVRNEHNINSDKPILTLPKNRYFKTKEGSIEEAVIEALADKKPTQFTDPDKQKMVGVKDKKGKVHTKVVKKDDPKYANHPEHESVEVDSMVSAVAEVIGDFAETKRGHKRKKHDKGTDEDDGTLKKFDDVDKKDDDEDGPKGKKDKLPPWLKKGGKKDDDDDPKGKKKKGKKDKEEVEIGEELPVGHRSPSPGSDSTDSYHKLQNAKRKAKAAGKDYDRLPYGDQQKYHEEVKFVSKFEEAVKNVFEGDKPKWGSQFGDSGPKKTPHSQFGDSPDEIKKNKAKYKAWQKKKSNSNEEVEVDEGHPGQKAGSHKLKKGYKMTANGDIVRVATNPSVLSKRKDQKDVESSKVNPDKVDYNKEEIECEGKIKDKLKKFGKDLKQQWKNDLKDFDPSRKHRGPAKTHESKEVEAGERDVGSDAYADYVADTTPGEGITSKDAKKSDVAKKKELAYNKHRTTKVDEGKVRDWLKKPLKGGDALRPGSGWEKRNDAAKKKKEEVEMDEGSTKAGSYNKWAREGGQQYSAGNPRQRKHGGVSDPEEKGRDADSVYPDSISVRAKSAGTAAHRRQRGVKKVRGAKEEVGEGRKVPGEQKPERVIDKINRIVKDKQYEKIHGQKVDLFTASAIQQVYDKINKNNQEKMEKVMSKDVRGLMKMAKFSMQQMK